jgi:hypothetical protein
MRSAWAAADGGKAAPRIVEDFRHVGSAHRKALKVHGVLSIPLGVVVARIDMPPAWHHAWATQCWRPVSVFLNPPEIDGWRELRRDAAQVHYQAAARPLTLHRKETIGYLANLAAGSPLVYVVLREHAGDPPLDVALVTASPYEAEVYGQNGDEIVGGVAMPVRLAELLEAFVAEHHVEEPFIKRQRGRHPGRDDYAFGQEPIAELRQRTRGRGGRADV